MMGHCKTCKWWKLPEGDEDYRTRDIIFPTDPVTFDQVKDEAAVGAKYGHRVRVCKSPKLTLFERPGKDRASITDASEYFAALLTGEDFGCTSHEQIEPPTG